MTWKLLNMRKLLWIAACFLIMGCGNNRHSSLKWPAHLAGLEGFSDGQRKMVVDAIADLNLKIQRTVVTPEGLQPQSSDESGSPIYIRFAQTIPEQTSAIAGRATVDGDKCVVQISSIVANDDALLVPVLWHELGHCAGLSHDPTKGEVMYKITYSMREYDNTAFDRFFSRVLEASGLNQPH